MNFKRLYWSGFEFCLFVIKGFSTDFKLLFDTEFKYENLFSHSALVFFYSTFNFLSNMRNISNKLSKKNIFR